MNELSFEKLKRKAEEERNALLQSKKPLITVGTATCGRAAGALEVLEMFQQELENRNIECSIIEVGCMGLCYAENQEGQPIFAVLIGA